MWDLYNDANATDCQPTVLAEQPLQYSAAKVALSAQADERSGINESPSVRGPADLGLISATSCMIDK